MDDKNNKKTGKVVAEVAGHEGVLLDPENINGTVRVRDNCFCEVVAGKAVRLTNFTARIVNETWRYQNDGSSSIVFEIEGTTKEGSRIKPNIQVTPAEFKAMKWVDIYWPTEAEIFNDKNKLKVYRAIKEEREGVTRVIKFPASGYFQSDGAFIYVYKDGAVGPNGVKSSVRMDDDDGAKDCCAWEKVSKSNAQEATLYLLHSQNLLFMSSKGQIGLMLLTSVAQALLSYILPIKNAVVIVSKVTRDIETLAYLARSFFNNSAANVPMRWTDDKDIIADRLERNNNSVISLSNFSYPLTNRNAFADKVKKLLNLAFDGDSIHKPKKKLKDLPIKKVNVVLITTACFAPTEMPEEIHERVLYVPVQSNEIDTGIFESCQEWARKGEFLYVAALFARYLLMQDQDELRAKINTTHENNLNTGREKHNLHSTRLAQYASLSTAFCVYTEFLEHFKVIDAKTASDYQSKANRRFAKLIIEQDNYHKNKTSMKSVVLDAIFHGLCNEEVYLKDYRNSEYVYRVVEDNGVALKRKKRTKAQQDKDQLGWYDANNSNLYIRSEFSFTRFYGWIPDSPLKGELRTGKSGFWKQMSSNTVIDPGRTDGNMAKVTPYITDAEGNKVKSKKYYNGYKIPAINLHDEFSAYCQEHGIGISK